MSEWRTARSETAETLETLRTSPIVLGVVILFLLVFAGTAYAVIQHYKTIDNNVDVIAYNCEAWWDAELTDEVTTINWGEIEVGDSKTVTMYIHNINATVPATYRHFVDEYEPWNAYTVMELTWSYVNNTPVGPLEAIPVDFTLSIDEEAWSIETFSFQITIIADRYIDPVEPAEP